MKPSATRTWDVVLWGATGFTGRLVAEALAAGAPIIITTLQKFPFVTE